MWIKRRTGKGEHVQVKKERGKRGETWLIHPSEVNALSEHDPAVVKGEQEGERVNTVSLDRYDAMRKEVEQERDQALQGLMMYRYKYEEMDRQMKLLPAPPEVVTSKLQELEEKAKTLDQAQRILKQAQEMKEKYKASMIELKTKLQEEEKVKAELITQLEQERKRPWWQRLWKR
jgi:flagellar biosynthesis GTPase FlhF